nr:hypothetical protein [Ktedonobacteraceae bacterium]
MANERTRHINWVSLVTIMTEYSVQRRNVINEQTRMVGGTIRGQPDPPASGGIPDVGLAERGRRRRTGVVASPQPLRYERH